MKYCLKLSIQKYFQFLDRLNNKMIDYNSNMEIKFEEIEEVQSSRNLFQILIDESQHPSMDSSSQQFSSLYNYGLIESTDEQTNELRQVRESVEQGNRKTVYILSSGKDSQTNACRCIKTECIKNYCPCHRNNKKCSSLCRCSDCHNKKAPVHIKTTIENFWQYSHLLRE